MWSNLLAQQNDALHLSEDFHSTLHQARLRATGEYLIQHHNLKQVKHSLNAANIAHVVYKGAHNRELLYSEPALRPAVDIDILVSSENKTAAIKTLMQAGYSFEPLAINISHEASLKKGSTCIDLHWDILRPGRARTPIAATLLNTKKDHGSHWGMSNEAAAFVMLVHPVFAKYGTAPQAALMRQVDLHRILALETIHWPTVIRYLESCGLKTAAWITLHWHSLITDTFPVPEVMQALAPGPARRAYLRYWVNNNLSSRMMNTPIAIQLGLTLPAHDKFSDAIRAVKRAKVLQQREQKELQQIMKKVNG